MGLVNHHFPRRIAARPAHLLSAQRRAAPPRGVGCRSSEGTRAPGRAIHATHAAGRAPASKLSCGTRTERHRPACRSGGVSGLGTVLITRAEVGKLEGS
jgi:hypothetical protein